jgi:hypothetical protein
MYHSFNSMKNNFEPFLFKRHPFCPMIGGLPIGSVAPTKPDFELLKSDFPEKFDLS